VNTSMLAEELAPLNAQIEQTRQKHEAFEDELRVVGAELEKFSTERQRFDALRGACDALDKLVELKADDLFWEGIPKIEDAGEHVKRARERIDRFEGEISGILEKQASLKEQISQCSEELRMLNEEISLAYDHEARRMEEFILEREVSPVPYRAVIMPWTKEAESEKRFRRAVLTALLICFVFGAPIPMIKVPIPDRSVTVVEIPKRLVKLVKTELYKPQAPRPAAKQAKEEPSRSQELAKAETEQQQKPQKQPQARAPETKSVKMAKSGGGGGASAARVKAERVGLLAFREAFADLMKETPVAKLGTKARLSNETSRVKGRAMAQRSLVAIQAQEGSSGGISNAQVSRNIGSGNVDRLGGIGIGIGGMGSGKGIGLGNGDGIGNGSGPGIGRMASTIANLEESSRPLSEGLAAGRTDEEIQIVFDRYKAALYRIYNKELRKDPTLRGKMILRISIESAGEVSMCKVESTDLASPELVAQIVERIKRFNFGPKEGVPRITILYPIDFLPAG